MEVRQPRPIIASDCKECTAHATYTRRDGYVPMASCVPAGSWRPMVRNNCVFKAQKMDAEIPEQNDTQCVDHRAYNADYRNQKYCKLNDKLYSRKNNKIIK